MNANTTKYHEFEVRTRKDTIAASALLVTMVLSALSGAFVAEADPAAARAEVARYASSDAGAK